MKTKSVMATRGATLLFLTALGGGGCGPDLLYLPRLAIGQLGTIVTSVPIEEALNNGDLAPEEAAKLELVVDARAYGIETIGLSFGQSFTTFVDTSSQAYNVSACQKDRFEPVTWTFPIFGIFPYLIFFDRAEADRYFERLAAADYDVFMYEVDAYSTMNAIPNPVRSTMLRRSEFSLVETVLHEMLHDTVWKVNATTFNESLATFVGRTGAVAYFRDRFPDEPELVETAMARNEDNDRYNAFLFELYWELDAFYGSDRTRAEKIAGREEIVQGARDRFAQDIQPLMNFPENYDWVEHLPANNAWLLGHYRYNLDLEVFGEVYEAVGGDWAAALEVFRQASRADDPFAFLRAWVASAGNPE